MKRSLAGWPVLLLIVAMLATACAQLPLLGSSSAIPSGAAAGTTAPGRAPKVGELAPDFSLPTPDGKLVKLSDFRGRPVFVNYWATWCPPCRAEMPDVEAIHQEYKDRGLVVLGVDVMEDAEIVKQFLRERSFSWTFVLDEDGEVSLRYQLSSLPTSFFIDRDGVIRGIQVGALTKSAMERRVAAMLPDR